jgi:anti-anti-sigma regulatory factor
MPIEMPKIAVRAKVDDTNIVSTIDKVRTERKETEGEVQLDCRTLRRLDGNGMRALTDLARWAREKEVKVVIRGVNVELYKVLKLARLTSTFVFVDEQSLN